MTWKITVSMQTKCFKKESQTYVNNELIRILKKIRCIEGETKMLDDNGIKSHGWKIEEFFRTFKDFNSAIKFFELIKEDLFFIKLEKTK